MAGDDVLKQVVEKTDNDILLLVIVISVVSLVIAIPLYKAVSKAAQERRQQEMEREQMILNVIKENTQINASLKTLLETSNSTCTNCREEQLHRFDNISSELKQVTILLTKINTVVESQRT